MTGGASGDQDRIRELRAETIAAIEERAVLATEARRALIAAWESGRICRSGCAGALAGWGLEPLPGEWTMFAAGQLSYVRTHIGVDEAREEARRRLPDDVRRLLPEVFIRVVAVVDVALMPGEVGYAGAHRYRVTVHVSVRVPVAATSRQAAIAGADALVGSRQSHLAGADITLTGLVWEVYGGPDDLVNTTADATDTAGAEDGTPGGTADTSAGQPSAVRLPEVGDALAVAIEARDAAARALAGLQRGIRHRAIRALVDEEIGGWYEETAEEVERFLLNLGLAGLPRAYHVTAVADLCLRVGADTGHEAYAVVRDAVRANSEGRNDVGAWTAAGWCSREPSVLDDGRWLVGWQHEYEVWVRGQAVATERAAASEALVRAELADTLAHMDHDLVLTVTSKRYGIDPHLDPDTD